MLIRITGKRTIGKVIDFMESDIILFDMIKMVERKNK